MMISYIIPVYNGEKYLHKCIESLINQNYQNQSFEIICIDDCSSDNSAAILSDFASRYPNIKAILLEKNCKTGTVCNIGLDNAQGDYVWIIGQDDWIDIHSIEILSPLMHDNQPDLIVFNYRRVSFDEEELHSAKVFDNKQISNGSEYIKNRFGEAFPHYLLGYEWRAIFSQKFLLKEQIRFPDHVIYEDTTFLFKAMFFSNNYCTLSDFLYYYRVNENSITDVNKKYKGALAYEFSFITGREVYELAQLLKNTYPYFYNVLNNRSIWYFNDFAHKIIAASLKEKLIFYKLVSVNKLIDVELFRYLKFISRILLLPGAGLLLSIIMNPFYYIKNNILLRRKRKEWCY